MIKPEIKTLISILLIADLMVCLLFINKTTTPVIKNTPAATSENKSSSTQPINYNLHTDNLINDVMNSEPLQLTVSKHAAADWSDSYILQYHSIRVTVHHHKYVPYYTQDNWEYFAHYENGQIIMINSTLELPEHKISTNTYERIKNICLSQNTTLHE